MTIDTYNTYSAYPKIPYNIITHLFQNENICKLLKYSSDDALSKTNLTIDEKRALIYNGEENATLFRFFQDMFIDDAFTEKCTFIRVNAPIIQPIDKVKGLVSVVIDICTHVKTQYLSNDYITRLPYLTQQVIESLNGQLVGGVGVLYFDKNASTNCGVKSGVLNNRNYVYSQLTFVTEVSNPR